MLQKLRKVKQETAELEKPEVVKTHLRNMLIIPEMVGSIIGVYNGKVRTEMFVCRGPPICRETFWLNVVPSESLVVGARRFHPNVHCAKSLLVT